MWIRIPFLIPMFFIGLPVGIIYVLWGWVVATFNAFLLAVATVWEWIFPDYELQDAIEESLRRDKEARATMMHRNIQDKVKNSTHPSLLTYVNGRGILP